MATLLALGALVAFAALTTPRAVAQAPPFFTQIPSDGIAGADAGQLAFPRGVVTDPSTGHVYVVEQSNQRISEFNAWGVFVKAWGWGVLDGSAELQVCTGGSGCQAGLEGSGPGQLDSPLGGMAIDNDDDALYVNDFRNLRVQKFSSTGEFLLMFGGEVNKTTGADVCTKADLEASEECGIGVAGAGPGEFASWEPGTHNGAHIGVGPDGTVYVGDEARIQKFDSAGTYVGEIPLPEGRDTKSLAVDLVSGDLYVALDQDFAMEMPEVPSFFRLSPTTGAVLDEIEVGSPDEFKFTLNGFAELLTVDSAGNVYVIAQQKMVGESQWHEVLGFDASGACIPGLCRAQKFAMSKDGAFLAGIGTGSGCNVSHDTLYVSHIGGSGKSYVRIYGEVPDADVCPAPPAPPVIEDQYALSADTDGATVRAEINPRFWSTTYYVEYGTEDCALGGCEQVLAPGASLGGGERVNVPLRTASVVLGSLQPDTTYHYRFIAESEGGGPTLGADHVFTTLALPDPGNTDCPNQALRTGAAAKLPDCRAYEMVSPVDKANGDAMLLGDNARRAQLNQGSLDGVRFTFSSYRPFADPQGGPATSQYLATRDPGAGWGSKPISPPRGLALVPTIDTAGTEFKVFSPDLCQGWLRHDTDLPPFDPAGIAGYSNLYRRDLCGDGGYEAQTRLVPPLTDPSAKTEKFLPELQGASADGECTLYRADGRLSEEASDAKDANKDPVHQVYLSCGEELRLASVLPDGSPCVVGASGGTFIAVDSTLKGRGSSVTGALSADGARVYWSCGTQLYLRENAGQPQSEIAGGECTEPERACTYPVSAPGAFFWAASATGSQALFALGGNLYRYDAETRESTLVAKSSPSVLGQSEDLSRVYLVSKEALDGGAKAGELNLYLHEAGEGGGAFSFIGALSSTDTSATPYSLAAPIPFKRATRVTPDGGQLAFMSSASLTGKDNLDAESGKPNAEVFLYEAESGELACVSCNRSGVRPAGREFNNGSSFITIASKLPTWETQLYPERALSEDGQRLYFESYQPLELADTNGAQDVYQWEAEGSGDCDADDPAFSEDTGGCVELVSSGQSPVDSEFLDATPNGSDVFFATEAGLLPQDTGLVDVYDARVGGGFPPPPPALKACEGEACQGTPSPPDDPTPSSLTFRGAGNVAAGGARPRCGKGRRAVRKAGKTRCVRKQGKKGQPQKSKRQGRKTGRAAR